ncbi:MAG TPA: LysR family transcriptional regulator [Rhodanobacteraceae bacterium]|nr:LysR family transcriptional regulator [Rhodanobacteraceae bacterium]
MAEALSWDDLQYFLAVCRHSTIGGAARWLGVNHSTVLRRISSLEATLDQRLFDRLPGGYALTEHGHELAASLAGVAEQIETAQRRIAGGDLAIQGVIRLTSTDTLLQGLLLPYIGEFHARHPAVQVQIVINNSFLNLTQREADVAVRGSNRPPENLIGRRVGTIETALYASRDYLKSLPKRHGHDDYRWIAPDDSLAHIESAKWMRQHVKPDRIAMRVDNLVGIVDLVAAGLGVGLLLCPLADRRRELVRIEEPMRQMDTQIWVLTHPDLKHVARIRALTDFLFERLSVDAKLRHDVAPPRPR